jgi:hypothetical protein
MNRFKVLAIMLASMFALAAVLAASASATELALGPAFLLGLCEGPRLSPLAQKGFLTHSGCLAGTGEEEVPAGSRYYVDRTRLETLELAKVTPTNLGDFTLTPSSGPAVLCSGLTAPTLLLGGTPGKSQTEINFSGCTVPTGTKCDANSKGATGGLILVNAKDELVYTGTKREAENEEGKVGDLFLGEKEEGGVRTFVVLTFEALSGGRCPTGAVESKVTGSVVGLVEPVNAMSSGGMLRFPSTAVSPVYKWTRHGTVTEVKPQLEMFGFKDVESGLADLELESKGIWGVLTA